MAERLYIETASQLLLDILKGCMKEPLFDQFRLVGGTALSLQRGHRKSVDIDLFTDADYQTINFKVLEFYFKNNYPYTDSINIGITGIGTSFYVGNQSNDCVKIDLFYTDNFIRNQVIIDHIRMASIEEIIAMKMDVIQRGGRKKDFWDIHELLPDFSIQEMFALHRQRYAYNHDAHLLKQKFLDFTLADDDFEPICLKGKYWELIKLDLIDFANKLS